MLGVDSFESVTQADIDSARSAAPQIEGALAAMTGTDTDGTPVTIATIRLRATRAFRTLNGGSTSWRPGLKARCA